MFKVEVIADSSGTWSGNSLTFYTCDDAVIYAEDLSYRWTNVLKWRVVDMETNQVVAPVAK